MFYFKLAFNNLKHSFKHFAPFFLVGVTTFVFSNITLLLEMSPMAASMGTGQMALGLAYIVLAILSAILCLYSYHFLLKQRHQEFGLYNIIGMNKSQIIRVASIELFVIYLITVLLGLIFSAIFSNFFYLIFVNIIDYKDLHFSLTAQPFIINTSLFAAIFVGLELVNIRKIGRTSALNLFKNQSQGEREPKGNLILALIALLALAYGYHLSLSAGNSSALIAIGKFFQAILAVILGTYLFYISFTTWYLKARRKNKKYFYQSEHFVNTSQMIFRMKQNAVGLANITLLAIMAFVTVFSTVALYTNTNNLIKDQFPKSSVFELINTTNQEEADALIKNYIEKPLGKDAKSLMQYSYSTYAVNYPKGKNQNLIVDKVSANSKRNLVQTVSKMEALQVMTQDEFIKLGNQLEPLSEHQVAVYDFDNSQSHQFKTLSWMGKTYQNVHQIKQIKNVRGLGTTGLPGALMIVANRKVASDLLSSYQVKGPEKTKMTVSQTRLVIGNLSKANETKFLKIANKNSGTLAADENGGAILYYNQKNSHEEILKMMGGFLFVGFLLGIAFLLGAALIIYYKQLSEGVQDKESYRILQEVGMSLKQVKKTINSQVILVFFLPLVMAIIHFIFALPILKSLLTGFGVQSDSLIYTVSAGTILVILLIYFGIYRLTSRTYYKIIER
ncbi:ABC transporter permease [Streptococcus caballi]|uniref:ABC transporter permease n=1 Tax=Streptococcus caballi TaxID=439220 RepID=UPI000373A3FD|nr:ABC transporter permease [Streptococcus caballi]